MGMSEDNYQWKRTPCINPTTEFGDKTATRGRVRITYQENCCSRMSRNSINVAASRH